MECVWTDYIGSTEDCEVEPWEEVEVVDLFYGAEGPFSSVFIYVNTGHEDYALYDFDITGVHTIYILATESLATKADAFFQIGFSTTYSVISYSEESGEHLHGLEGDAGAGETVGDLTFRHPMGSDSQTLSVIGIKLPNTPMFRFTAITVSSYAGL